MVYIEQMSHLIFQYQRQDFKSKSMCNDRTYDIFISYVLVYVVCLGDVGTDV